jgi:trimethylamine:corrinoid methyltransferase-like protein
MMTHPRFTYFSQDQLELLKEKSFDLLEKRGVKMDHPTVLKILSDAGAQVDFDTSTVRFPRDFIKEQLLKAPKKFDLVGRNGKHRLTFPHPEGTFHTRTNTGAQSWIEPVTGRYRRVELQDVAYWGRLTDRLEHIGFCAFPVPSDVPGPTADVYALRALLQNMEKHIWIQPYTGETIEYLMKLLVAAAGGEDSLRRNPLASWITCSLSPFEFKRMDLEVILQACRHGVPMQPCSLPGAGTTGPITVPGTALLGVVENLVMLATAQVIQPGIPIIATSLQFSADMRTGTNLQSSVEALRQSVLFAQTMQAGFGIPAHTYGSGSDSPDIDGQGMTERAMMTVLMAASGSSVLGAAGQVEVACTDSPVQLVIDNEVFGMTKAIISEMRFDDDALGWEDLLQCKPGSEFTTSMHTLKHCRESFVPVNFTRSNRSKWELKKEGTLVDRATAYLQDLMKDAAGIDLPAEVVKEMDEIVAAADQRLVR